MADMNEYERRIKRKAMLINRKEIIEQRFDDIFDKLYKNSIPAYEFAQLITERTNLEIEFSNIENELKNVYHL